VSDERGMPCRMKYSVLPYLECYQIEKESVTKMLLRLDGVFEQRKHESSMQYRGYRGSGRRRYEDKTRRVNVENRAETQKKSEKE